MSSVKFDPYYKWLGIPPAEQPPNHYRLLGISIFESDPEVIQAAADQRMIHLRSFQNGQNSAFSQKLLNETAAAKLCLLKKERKAQYDTELRSHLAAHNPPSIAVTLASSVPPPLPVTSAPAPIVNPAAADYSDVVAATATAQSSGHETTWSPDPHDFTSPGPVYSKSVGAPRSKSMVPVAMLIAAPIIGIVVVMAAIKVFNDREDAENSNSFNSSTASSSALAKPSAEIQAPMLVLDWPKDERAGGFVILGDKTHDVSSTAGRLQFELKPGQSNKVGLRRLGFAPIDILLPPKKAGEHVSYQPNWEPLNHDEPPKVASIERPRIPQIVQDHSQDENPRHDNPLENPRPNKNPLDLSPPDGVRSAQPAIDDHPKIAAGRSPIPDKAAQEKALAQLKDVMKDDFSLAKSPEAQIALAMRLAALAEQETRKDPVTGYVAADQALQIAVKQCNIPLASQLVGGFVSHFDLDAWKLRSTTLTQLGHVAKSPDQKASLAKAALEQIDKAVADDRFEVAVELAATANFLSAQVKDPALRDIAKEASERTRRIQRGAQEAKTASDALAANPKDPEASVVVGKFKCFLKEDWRFGLALLAQGNDEVLQKLAVADSADPIDPAEQAKLADQWWDLAEKRAADKTEAGRKDEWTIKPMRARAVYWYRRALPGLTGLVLAKAQKRIDEGGTSAGDSIVSLDATYLDDLSEIGASVGHGNLGKHGEAGYFPPGKFKVRGSPAPHALSMHPPSNGSSNASYNVDGKYRSFTGIVAIMDDAKQMQSKAIFRVYGDGKQLWSSSALRGAGEYQECTVKVTGVQILKLEVICTGPSNDAHAVWVAPMLTK
ncbi:MAG TPA: NPCBM/NEW2 domain-containing protein [Pirellulales bacterium]|nr:NPCBM/NEW2 domain-containing protein [Pirellulales bacterium]